MSSQELINKILEKYMNHPKIEQWLWDRHLEILCYGATNFNQEELDKLIEDIINEEK